MSKHPPRLAGRSLAAVRTLAETPGASVLVRNLFKKCLRIDVLADLPESFRSDLADSNRPLQAREPSPRPDAYPPPAARAFPRPWTA
ncbi:MAG: amidase, partial [Polyangiaceae bacterium]|nr:amidase [Polyangiaceae bacterium]